jgi:N-acetylneuraminic acid mutarotase
MKTCITKSLVYFILLLFSGNILHAQNYVWTQKADFGGGPRFAPFYFTIGNKGYAGSGLTFSGGQYIYGHQDFWEYDPTTNVWTQKLNFAGTGRSAAAGFVLGGDGYVSTGWTPSQVNDTWKYDTSANSWTSRANFAGSARYSTAYFSIGNFAYVGMGYTPLSNDFWRYDPSTNSWTQIANIGGSPRQAATGIAVGNFGYVFGGTLAQFSETNQLWRYDPQSNLWTQKTSMPDTARYGSAIFTINGKVYIGLGATGNYTFNDFYEYDPANDTWSPIADLPANKRYGGLSFSIGNRGYVGAGSLPIVPTPTILQDFWEYGPAPSGINGQVKNSSEIKVFMKGNILNFYFYEPVLEVLTLKIFDASGKLIAKNQLQKNLQNFELPLYTSKGVFIYELSKDNSKIKTGKFNVN